VGQSLYVRPSQFRVFPGVDRSAPISLYQSANIQELSWTAENC
jgi:hypothetical protein